MDAAEYAKGFKGLEVVSLDGTDFINSYEACREVIEKVRTERRPFLIHAKVPLLGHQLERPHHRGRQRVTAEPDHPDQAKELGLQVQLFRRHDD